MEPSSYQLAIFEHINAIVKDGANSSNVLVEALAGSGKSTTGKMMLRHIPITDSVLAVAFNKLIAAALEKDIKSFHPRAEACTLHSFGFRTLKSVIRRCQVDQYKTENILQGEHFDLRDKKEKARYYQLRACISRLVSLLKADAFEGDPSNDDILSLAETYGVEIPGKADQVARIAAKTFERSRELIEDGIIDFDDMIYGPVHLRIKPQQYRWIFTDEFQDMARSQLQLLYMIGGNMIAFGDRHQSIYMFRGAMASVMDDFVVAKSAVTLPLSICYRCPKAVIAEAQKFVPEIEAAPNAKEGTVATIKSDEFAKSVGDGDFVLCRNTAPLVSWCLRMIQEGRKAFVKGRDIGKNLIVLLGKVNDSASGDDLMWKLKQYRMDELDRLSRADRKEQIDRLNDQMDTLVALHDGCAVKCAICGLKRADHVNQVASHDFEIGNVRIGDIEDKIESIFSDENRAGIMFSTIHKCKGLESPKVFILKGSGGQRDMNAEQRQQERNIQYVAVTRSLDQLYFIKD